MFVHSYSNNVVIVITIIINNITCRQIMLEIITEN